MTRECRFCSADLQDTFVDLGMSPLSNAYISIDVLNSMERFYPLHTYVCRKCLLVQLEAFESPEAIFSDYAYFSSYSDSWLTHCRDYVDQMLDLLNLGPKSKVVEIASNDGYLLQYFKEEGVPVLGVEPAANVAKEAEKKGIPSVVKFFGRHTATELVRANEQADLLLGNNVLAHVPDLNDFVAGMKILLKPTGVITMEFPHVLQLIEQNQFDTIYHEHFSYFSFITVEKVFAAHGLTLFDVEEIPTHGGSLRIYGCHQEDRSKKISASTSLLKEKEEQKGLSNITTYRSFQAKVQETKRAVLEFLIKAKREGKKVVGYGAPAKGNTLLNYCGVRQDFIDFTVDRNPHKQNHFLPGVHIPIKAPDTVRIAKPDYLFILPWNIKDEIMHQMSYIKDWGGRFVVPIPSLKVY